MVAKSHYLRKGQAKGEGKQGGWGLRHGQYGFWLCASLTLLLVAGVLVSSTILLARGSVTPAIAAEQEVRLHNPRVNGVEAPVTPATRPQAPTFATAGQGVALASKTGTKFYYPHCAGVKRIKPQNQIWFASVADAYAAGYQLAKGCK